MARRSRQDPRGPAVGAGGRSALAGRRGGVIVVTGPDGAGKSTLCDELSARLPDSAQVVRLHHRPGVLPVRGGRDAFSSTDPHRAAAYPAGVSGIKTLFLFADYALGWRLRIRPVVSEGGWVIIERGWWDLVVDPKRYRLRPGNAVARLLGRLLPRPDLTIVLEAPQAVLSGRKDELSPQEIERQALAWREVLPRRTPRLYADATLPPQETARQILDRLGLERAQKSRGAWMNLPRRGAPRWYLPREPRAVARAGLSIHQPMSPKALVGWVLGRAAVSLGAARLAPKGDPPPRDVSDLVAKHLQPSLHVAVARVHEQARYGCLAMNDAGSAVAFAKIDLGLEGRESLNREADATERFAALLPAPLAAPALFIREPSLLLFEPVSWRPRLRPWHLPTDVAVAMGRFYAPRGDGPETGPTHGDFTPWNLFRTKEGWLLIDWEAATGDGPPFFDLWHYLVQSHTLLGRPGAQALIEGLDGRGWVGKALSAYAGAAGLARANARSSLIHYLSASRDNFDHTAPFAAGALKARDALLDRVKDTTSVSTVPPEPIPPLRVVAISHALAAKGPDQVRMIGAELGIWQVLADMGVRVLRLCPAADGQTATELGRLSKRNLQVQGHRIVPSRPLTFSRYPHLRRILAAAKPDVVHVLGEPWHLGGRGAIGVAHQLGALSGIHFAENGPAVTGWSGSQRNLLARATIRRVDFVVAWSRSGLALARQRWRFRGLGDVLPGVGVPAHFFETKRERGPQRVVLFVGRLTDGKGVDDFLEVAQQLRSPSTRFEIVGDGPLRHKVVEAERRGDVRYLGLMERDELASVYARAHILVVPSRPSWVLTKMKTKVPVIEQFGRVVAEALAVGTPVVAYSTGAIPDVVGPGGVVVSEGDRDGLVAATRGLLRDDGRWEALSRAARDQGRLYSDHEIAEALLSLWRVGLTSREESGHSHARSLDPTSSEE